MIAGSEPVKAITYQPSPEVLQNAIKDAKKFAGSTATENTNSSETDPPKQ